MKAKTHYIAMAGKQSERRYEMTQRYKAVFEHDFDPDFSWLEQDMYNPASSEYEPTYRTKADMEAGREPFDPEWYRNPDNHVALSMCVYYLGDDDEDWQLIDSLGNIDFLADSDDWQTGTFYDPSQVRSEYLRELFQGAINEHAKDNVLAEQERDYNRMIGESLRRISR